jgi:membrane protein DedA with SNARE-associated domain
VFTPVLAAQAAWLLALLAPSEQNIVLAAANEAPALVLLPLIVARLTVADPLWYSLGYAWGDRATVWLRGGARRAVTVLERGFEKSGCVSVFLFPNAFTAVLAGATLMNRRRFLAANVAGTIPRAAGVWWLAEQFDRQTTAVTNFLVRFQWPLVGLLAVIVAVQAAAAVRAHRRSIPDAAVPAAENTDSPVACDTAA